MSNGKVFPQLSLRSGEITLRVLKPSDAPRIVTACNEPETQKWLPLPMPYRIQNADWFIDEHAVLLQASGQGIVFGIEHEDKFVGCIDIKHADWINRTCEIGFWMMPEYRGRGWLTYALDMLSEWVLRQKDFARVELRSAVGNFACQRAAEKANFIREGIARDGGRVHSGRVDLVVFARLAKDLVEHESL